ncbi:unnamed protein product [Vicia faba]|uniref:Uncharacterized protein n=1 Tax=Vicia faba TaxID=3906 RepID=A0AAV1AUR9_VICFA|nr:unnamed protein product [Vicia faba]
MAGATRSTNEKLDNLAQVLTRFQDHFNLRMDGVTNCVESLECCSPTPETINLHHDNESEHTPRHILKLYCKARFVLLIADEDERETGETGNSNFGSLDHIMALFDPLDTAHLALLSYHAMSST